MPIFFRETALRLLAAAAIGALSCSGQSTDSVSAASVTPPSDKRVLWIIPNYRTIPMPAIYKPLTPKQELDIATADSSTGEPLL
jgi:hypothetical protein